MASIAEHQVTLRAPRVRLAPETVRDLFLVGLAITSGAVDAIVWLTLGKVFTAFQTGNIVFFALDVAGADAPSLNRVLISIGVFALGVLLAVPIVRPTKGTSLWPRRVSIALGFSVLTQIVFLIVWVAADKVLSTDAAYLLIALSALAMGLQSGAVMSLGVPAVFTTAATATVIEFASDLSNKTPSTTDIRRVGAVLVGLFGGAVAGGLLIAHAHDYAPILPLAVTALVIASASLVLKPAPA